MILQIPESIIADTAATIFSAAEYARSRPSPLARAYRWLRDLLAPLGDSGGTAEPLFWWLVGAGALLVSLVLARAIYLARLRQTLSARDPLSRNTATQRSRGRDPWRAAEDLAAAGDFTGAAHSLYLALLQAVAHRERVPLHPAMTVGDYARALRNRSSSLFSLFREFAHSYETVVYGTATCDRARYERLRALALPIVHADG